MVQPCACTGSVQSAHLSCLRSWCAETLSLKCELCGAVYTDAVVAALMDTLVAAQSHEMAPHAFDAAASGAEAAEADDRDGVNRRVHQLQEFLDDIVRAQARRPCLA